VEFAVVLAEKVLRRFIERHIASKKARHWAVDVFRLLNSVATSF